jgi:hypothetical protein
MDVLRCRDMEMDGYDLWMVLGEKNIVRFGD